MIQLLTWLCRKSGAVIAAILLAVVFYSAATSWYDSKMESAYQSGVSDTNTKWERIVELQEKKAYQMKISHSDEVKSLEKRLSQVQDRLNKELAGSSKQKYYAESSDGKKSTIPDQVIEIYNDSINMEVK